MPLITRQGKGSKLTISEMDGNLTGLNSGQFIFEDFLTANIDFPQNSTGGFIGGTVTIPELANPGLVIQNLEDELYEPFLAPIVDTNQDANLFGQIIQVSADTDFGILFNGSLFAGEGVFGAGNLNVFKQDDFFITQVNSLVLSFTYVYTYNSGKGDHSHTLTMEAPLFEILKTTVQVSLNDTATSWSDVTVNTYTLVAPI